MSDDVQAITGFPHLCNVCGRAGVWGPDWSVFGSLADEVEGTTVKLCGALCRRAFEANGRKLPLPDPAVRLIWAAQREQIYAAGKTRGRSWIEDHREAELEPLLPEAEAPAAEGSRPRG